MIDKQFFRLPTCSTSVQPHQPHFINDFANIQRHPSQRNRLAIAPIPSHPSIISGSPPISFIPRCLFPRSNVRACHRIMRLSCILGSKPFPGGLRMTNLSGPCRSLAADCQDVGHDKHPRLCKRTIRAPLHKGGATKHRTRGSSSRIRSIE